MKRTFDRVLKQLLTFSWIRLVAPPDVAEYLADIDIGGHSVVRTPLSQGMGPDRVQVGRGLPYTDRPGRLQVRKAMLSVSSYSCTS